MKTLEEPRSIRFEHANGRYYTILVGPSLFYANALIIIQGSVRTSARKRDEAFVTAAQLASRWRALVALRRRHGYEEIVSRTTSHATAPLR